MTSKRVTAFLEQAALSGAATAYIVADPFPDRLDPAFMATHRLTCSVPHLCTAIRGLWGTTPSPTQPHPQAFPQSYPQTYPQPSAAQDLWGPALSRNQGSAAVQGVVPGARGVDQGAGSLSEQAAGGEGQAGESQKEYLSLLQYASTAVSVLVQAWANCLCCPPLPPPPPPHPASTVPFLG